MWLAPDDVDEDTAAVRIASLVAGAGVETHSPVESQVRLTAATRGLLYVDAPRLQRLNAIEGVTVFTLPDGVPVVAGRTIAGVKVTPLAIPRAALDEVERVAVAASHGGRFTTVLPFRPLRLAAVVAQPVGEAERGRFERSLRGRADWFGGDVASIAYLVDGVDSPGGALLAAAANADLVLAVGVASVDPLEATWRALITAGAEVLRRGLPVHPGSSYWIVHLRGRPVIGVASCGMFSRRSALDLLLARCFTGAGLDLTYLATLGHGGLLAGESKWRVPP